MGHSYVEYRGRDILMHDIEIVTIVSVVLDAVRSAIGTMDLTSNVRELLKSWEHLLDGYGPGCLGFDLDRFVSSEEDRLSLQSLFEYAERWIGRQGPVVSGAYLNRIVDAPGVLEFSDRPLADIVASFAKFRGLLSTRLPGPK